jgi:hypothetical protein
MFRLQEVIIRPFLGFMLQERPDDDFLKSKHVAVYLRTTRFNIQKFYMVFALRLVFCTVLRTDSDFCFIHH